MASFKDDFSDDHMKLCFLWYDEVLYETLGKTSEEEWLSRLAKDSLSASEIYDLSDVIIPVDKRISLELSKKLKAFDLRGYPRWGSNHENFTYPNPESAEEYAHNMLLRRIEKEWGKLDGLGVEHAEGRARVAVDAVSMWKNVNREIPCMLQSTDDEKLAMSAASAFGAPDQPYREPFRLFEMSVPSLSNVPWKKIVSIKRKGKFDRLRDKLKSITTSLNGPLSDAQEELKKAEDEAMNEIVDQFRPNIKPVIAEALWSNIPNVPFLNPVSTYFGVKNIRVEQEKTNDFEWFYLLRDIKQLPPKHNENY